MISKEQLVLVASLDGLLNAGSVGMTSQRGMILHHNHVSSKTNILSLIDFRSVWLPIGMVPSNQNNIHKYWVSVNLIEYNVDLQSFIKQIRDNKTVSSLPVLWLHCKCSDLVKFSCLQCLLLNKKNDEKLMFWGLKESLNPMAQMSVVF